MVQAFINTNDIEGGREALASPDLLRNWLIGHDLLDDAESVAGADWEGALAVREALRSLLLANGGARVNKKAVEILNRAAESARLRVRFAPDGSSELEPAVSGVNGAIGKMVAVVSASMAEGTWIRLKACERDACRWAFYDHSKNRSGRWCSMAICGNKVKTRTYRRRQAYDKG